VQTILKMLASALIQFVVLGLTLFVSAGTVDYWQATTGLDVTRQWLGQAGGQMTIRAWCVGGDKIHFTLNA
jgi:hypothetical protein